MASLERQRQDKDWKSQAEVTRLVLQFIAAGHYDSASLFVLWSDIREANLNFDPRTLCCMWNYLLEICHRIEEEECLVSLRSFADTMSKIIAHWQHRADGKNPTRYAIKFLDGPVTATLLQVLALFPERYQKYIMIVDAERSDTGALSWLSEEIMDVLVLLSHQRDQPIVFGRGLASMAREDMDMMVKDTLGKDSYLEHLIEEMRKGDPDWNTGQVYTFPPSTEKIVFFWNHTQIHWTLLSTEIDEEQWASEHYNPFVTLSKSHTTARGITPDLFTLVQGASGFTKPKHLDFQEEPSAQQDNIYDCGIITVYNAVEILNGRTPAKEVDAVELRQHYLSLILSWLDTKSLADNDGNNTPESSVASPVAVPDNTIEAPAINSAIEEADDDNTSGFHSTDPTIDFNTSSDDDDDYSNMPNLFTPSPPADPSQPSLNADSSDSSKSNPSNSQTLSTDSETDNENHNMSGSTSPDTAPPLQNNDQSSSRSPLSTIPNHYEPTGDGEQPLSGLSIVLDRHESNEDGDDELSDLNDGDGNQF